MSDTTVHILHCDHYRDWEEACIASVIGNAGEDVHRLRDRMSGLGWVSRRTPPNAWQRAHNIHPTSYQDFCPAHAGDIASLSAGSVATPREENKR